MYSPHTHTEVAKQLAGESDAWLARVAHEFADGAGIFEHYVDASEYLLKYGTREIDVPRYYSRFHDEFEPVVSSWTIGGRGRAVGTNADDLERIVRLADGSGRIDHNEVSVYLCENDTLLAFGSRGAFIVDVSPLRHSSFDRDPPESAHVNIGQFAVPEADPDYQRGLRRFIEIFERHAEPTLTNYKRLSDGKHVFETDSGRDVYAGSQLRHLARMIIDETELRGAYNYDLDGDTHQSVWDSETASHALGDETHLGTVVGFDHTWTEKDHIMSNTLFELQSKVKYWCFQPRPEQYSHFDFQVGSLDEMIDTFANGS